MLPLLVGIASASSLTTASHHGVWTGARMEWRSTIRLSEADTVTLAAPLPADVTLLPDSDGEAIRDDQGRIVGFSLPWASELALSQPLPEGSTVVLTPPLIVSGQPQRVTLEGIDFVPDPMLGMESRVQCDTHPEISAEERQAIDERISGRRARLQEQPIYLIADERLSAGLVGQIQDGRRAKVTFGIAAGALFLGLLSMLAMAHRGLDRRARVEEAEAYLKREFIHPPAP